MFTKYEPKLVKQETLLDAFPRPELKVAGEEFGGFAETSRNVFPAIEQHETLHVLSEEKMSMENDLSNEQSIPPKPNLKTTIRETAVDWNDSSGLERLMASDLGWDNVTNYEGAADQPEPTPFAQPGEPVAEEPNDQQLSRAQAVFMKSFGNLATEETKEENGPLPEAPYSSLKPRLFQLMKNKGKPTEGNERTGEAEPPLWK